MDGIDGVDGENSKDGEDGQPCVAVNNGNGTHTITYPDGCEIVVQDADAVNLVVEGSVRIESSLQAAYLGMVTEITGELTVNATGMTMLSLPNLRKVGGTVQLWANGSLQSVSMPRIESVGGNFIISTNPGAAESCGSGRAEVCGQ